MEGLISITLSAVAAYGLTGLLFAIAFQWRGMAAIDSGARSSGFGFRLLVSPGIIALWPWLARRWLYAARGEVPTALPDAPLSPERIRSLHALVWKALAFGIPLLVGIALYWRPSEAPQTRWSAGVPPPPLDRVLP